MILTIIISIVILALALYLSSQGFLSSVLLLASALFASMLAMGVYEQVTPYLDSWRPDFSRGLSFLGVFFFTFSALRLLSDNMIKENIALPPLFNKIGGGVIGALAGMVIVGSCVTGFEMLPVGESIGGTPMVDTNVMPGKPNRTTSANLVTGLYYLASGRSLGGTPLGTVHPDLPAELIGYRHTVEWGSRTSLDPTLLSVDNWYMLTPELTAKFKINRESSKPLIVVRTQIKEGGEQPKVSWDNTETGHVLMLSDTQVRLVAQNDKGAPQQYYPVGILTKGRTFKEWNFGDGYSIDDFSNEKAITDWVFELDEGQMPQFIEVKYGGRQPLTDKKSETPLNALANAAYPPHHWEKGAATLRVIVKIDGKPVQNALVLRLNRTAKKQKIRPFIKGIADALGESQGYAQSIAIRLANAPDEDNINWSELLPLPFVVKKTSGISASWDYFNGPVKDAIVNSDSLKLEMPRTNSAGVSEGSVLGGDYVLFVVAKNDDVVRGWVRDFSYTVDEKKGENPTLTETFDKDPTGEITVNH